MRSSTRSVSNPERLSGVSSRVRGSQSRSGKRFGVRPALRPSKAKKRLTHQHNLISGRLRQPSGRQGTGFGGPETPAPKRPSPELPVSETANDLKIPAILGGNSRVFRNAPQTSDCVVAEAVAIEPVSTARFARNREKYRVNGVLEPK